MTLRVALVSHGLTDGMRRHVFGSHGELVGADRPAVSVLRRRLDRAVPRASLLTCSTDAAARDSAALLELDAVIDPVLDELDYGFWTGRSLDELVAEAPDSVKGWMEDPYACPHGGESIAAQVDRIGRWLDETGASAVGREGDRQVVAVTHPSVVRAAVVHALQMPLDVYWRLDCEPWSAVVLTGRAGRWNLRL